MKIKFAFVVGNLHGADSARVVENKTRSDIIAMDNVACIMVG